MILLALLWGSALSWNPLDVLPDNVKGAIDDVSTELGYGDNNPSSDLGDVVNVAANNIRGALVKDKHDLAVLILN